MLEIRNEDIFFEEDNSPEAIDKKIAQANIDHLNGLKAALDHNALNHRELETNVKILVEAAPTAILKKVLKMLIKDDLQDQQRKMENL
jgi:hypothetical protein